MKKPDGCRCRGSAICTNIQVRHEANYSQQPELTTPESSDAVSPSVSLPFSCFFQFPVSCYCLFETIRVSSHCKCTPRIWTEYTHTPAHTCTHDTDLYIYMYSRVYILCTYFSLNCIYCTVLYCVNRIQIFLSTTSHTLRVHTLSSNSIVKHMCVGHVSTLRG